MIERGIWIHGISRAAITRRRKSAFSNITPNTNGAVKAVPAFTCNTLRMVRMNKLCGRILKVFLLPMPLLKMRSCSTHIHTIRLTKIKRVTNSLLERPGPMGHFGSRSQRDHLELERLARIKSQRRKVLVSLSRPCKLIKMVPSGVENSGLEESKAELMRASRTSWARTSQVPSACAISKSDRVRKDNLKRPFKRFLVSLASFQINICACSHKLTFKW